MADLSDRETARGQILLIAAFTLAVIFVALALVVNSAIFTENLASRGEVAGSTEALTYKHQVEEGVSEAIAYANRYNYSSDSDLKDSIRGSVGSMGSHGGRQQARTGQLVRIGYEDFVPGERIADNDSDGGSSFESSSGLDNWTLADGVKQTRNFVITTELSDIPGPGSPPFRINANDTAYTTNVWTTEIWKSGGDVVIRVTTADGDTARCNHEVANAETFEIDVTDGIVDGEHCHALTRDVSPAPDQTPMHFATGIDDTSSYDIEFENGGSITGNYSMVVRPRGRWNGTTVTNGGPTSGTPFRTNAIYTVTVEYLFRTTQVVYEASIEVTPGEPR